MNKNSIKKILKKVTQEKFKRVFVVIITVVFSAYIFIFLNNEAKIIPYHEDEISWFFHTKFYEEFFIKRNFDRSIWETYGGYDHPPISKYIFGWYLFLKDPSVFTKRDTLEQQFGRWQFYFDLRLSDISSTPFAQYISTMRQVNIVFTWFTLVTLVILLRQLGVSWMIGFIGVFILVQNQLFQISMLRATSDSHMIFFLLLGIVFYHQYIQSKDRYWMALFAMSLSFSTLTKLTGALLFFPFVAFELMTGMLLKQTIMRNIRNILIVSFIYFLVWVILNPTLYPSPIVHSGEYFAFRIRQSAILQYYFPEHALLSFRDRTHAVYCTLFTFCNESYEKGQLIPWNWITFVLSIIGFIVLVIKAIQKNTGDNYLFTSLVIVILIISIWLSIPLNSDRYYLPMLILVFICFSLGISTIVRRVRHTVAEAFRPHPEIT